MRRTRRVREDACLAAGSFIGPVPQRTMFCGREAGVVRDSGGLVKGETRLHIGSIRRRFVAELRRVQLRVRALLAEQFGVLSALDDLTVIDHQNLVGGEDRGQPVRDGERRPPDRKARQGVLDQPLGAGVEGAGGLVEDQDARVLEDGAGDGDALLLAARKLIAALADDRIVAFRQADAIWSWMAAAWAASISASSVASGRP